MAERYSHGMDLGRVRSIADRLAAAQRDLAGVSTRADDAARQLREAWQGEDAQTFARRWPVLRQTLDDQASDLETLVRRLRQQAEEQERASGVGGNGDSDGDGTPNRRDQDDDNDGTPDPRDTDDDNDGTPDSKDDDTKGPGLKGKYDFDNPTNRDETDTSPRHRDDSTSTREDTTYRNKEGEDWERGWRQDRTWGTPPTDGEHAAGEHKGESRTDLKVRLAEGETKLWDAEYAGHTFGDEDGNHVRVEALSTEGKAKGEAYIGRDGLGVAGTATAGAYLLSASGKYANSYGTSAKGEAYIGAQANANAGLSLGLDGVKASAGGEAFIGGKAEGMVNQTMGPVDVGVGGEISYGIGAHAEGDIEVSADSVGVSVDVGATLGIGGGVKFDVEVDPTFWN